MGYAIIILVPIKFVQNHPSSIMVPIIIRHVNVTRLLNQWLLWIRVKPGCGTLPNAKVTHDIPVPEIFDKGIIIIKLSLGVCS